MAQPTPYERQFAFSGQPKATWAEGLENELNAVKVTSDETLNNLELIQRDDGALRNGIVTKDSLAPDLALAGLVALDFADEATAVAAEADNVAMAPLGVKQQTDARLADETTPDTDDEKLSTPEDVVRRVIENAILGAWKNAGAGAVERTIDAKLKDIIAEADYSTIAQARAAAAGGKLLFLSSGALEQKRTTTTGADVPNLNIERITSHAGGTAGYVNSAIRGHITAGAGTTAFEWALLGQVSSYSETAENVGVYGQARKFSTGPVWGGVFEARDVTHTSNPVNPIWGAEIDLMVNGPDNNNRRQILDLIFGNEDTSLTTGEVGYGIMLRPFAPDAGSPAGLAVCKTGFKFLGRYTFAGIDLSEATIDAGKSALLLAADQLVSFDTFHSLRYNGISGLTYKVGASDVLTISDSGSISTGGVYAVFGTQVVGPRKVGWTAATGTASRNSFATASVTLPQLAEHVKALTDDLLSHGLIGA